MDRRLRTRPRPSPAEKREQEQDEEKYGHRCLVRGTAADDARQTRGPRRRLRRGVPSDRLD